jgi:hypothetical protein
MDDLALFQILWREKLFLLTVSLILVITHEKDYEKYLQFCLIKCAMLVLYPDRE